jgi:hypothetical protein
VLKGSEVLLAGEDKPPQECLQVLQPFYILAKFLPHAACESSSSHLNGNVHFTDMMQHFTDDADVSTELSAAVDSLVEPLNAPILRRREMAAARAALADAEREHDAARWERNAAAAALMAADRERNRTERRQRDERERIVRQQQRIGKGGRFGKGNFPPIHAIGIAPPHPVIPPKGKGAGKGGPPIPPKGAGKGGPPIPVSKGFYSGKGKKVPAPHLKGAGKGGKCLDYGYTVNSQ